MRTCPDCGCEVAEGVRFCKNCGCELPKEDVSQNLCPNCGNSISEGVNFCRTCGFELNKKTAESNKNNFCPNCGYKMDDNMKFCPDCGMSTAGREMPSREVPVSNKNPALTALLSFLIIGLGQFYLGLPKKGAILFILAIFGALLTSIYIGYILCIAVWIYAMADGYVSANKINDGMEVEDKLDLSSLF